MNAVNDLLFCSDIVDKRKCETPGIDTTQILNQLLADDAWLEQVPASFSVLSQMFHFTNVKDGSVTEIFQKVHNLLMVPVPI
jgi:hypothetical protein